MRQKREERLERDGENGTLCMNGQISDVEGAELVPASIWHLVKDFSGWTTPRPRPRRDSAR